MVTGSVACYYRDETMRTKKSSKKHIKTKRFRYDVVAVCAAVMLCIGVIWAYSASPRVMLFGKIVPRIQTSQKIVALTLDDGPLPGTTEETLAQLKKADVPTTFFVIGMEAKQHPQQLKAIVDAGYDVGNHSYSHRVLMGVTQKTIQAEVEDTDTLIRQAGYQKPIYFRAPYNYKLVGLPWYLYTHNRVDISRDVVPSEGYDRSAVQIADEVVANVRPGSIILLHPMYAHTKTSREALPLISKRLKDQGYHFVTVTELLGYAK